MDIATITRADYNHEAAEQLKKLQNWASPLELREALVMTYLHATQSESYHSATHPEQKEMAKFLEQILQFLEGVQIWSQAEDQVEGEI
jgi:hypothetical protein